MSGLFQSLDTVVQRDFSGLAACISFVCEKQTSSQKKGTEICINYLFCSTTHIQHTHSHTQHSHTHSHTQHTHSRHIHMHSIRTHTQHTHSHSHTQSINTHTYTHRGKKVFGHNLTTSINVVLLFLVRVCRISKLSQKLKLNFISQKFNSILL